MHCVIALDWISTQFAELVDISLWLFTYAFHTHTCHLVCEVNGRPPAKTSGMLYNAVGRHGWATDAVILVLAA